MADEEPVDTMPAIREAVKPKCAADWKDYQSAKQVLKVLK
ncbi:hypothetical protein NGA_0210600 [Nannochloropsis gaditana CCMP526]|nr:hypothetical protein NGA_0210600 [Nannochloropsis gaditana CCMP526]EKU21907.1 hypothetical protein NGA_0210600 [Nannochloropsis gaditana CCMP526]|eukprot:XP_005854454.1 hypothetical protein NGA_0210600 [Nannochloropsis gaditana CCMP526]